MVMIPLLSVTLSPFPISVASSSNLWALVMDAGTGFSSQVHEFSPYCLHKSWVYYEQPDVQATASVRFENIKFVTDDPDFEFMLPSDLFDLSQQRNPTTSSNSLKALPAFAWIISINILRRKLKSTIKFKREDCWLLENLGHRVEIVVILEMVFPEGYENYS
ncbi:protein kinase family protein [Striga asiatica]|uniref:Protein kinase family protein n=1 Tax=Striga asiatica TaxID=4170 RepID=A0A5A7QBQ5_STRAF|nr:protein kinase family protein [Striga asiatica]